MFRGESGDWRRRGSSFNPEFAPLWPGSEDTLQGEGEEENEQITQDEGRARVWPGYTLRRGRDFGQDTLQGGK